MLWIILFIVAAVGVSVLVGGGVNWQFLKVLLCFIVGFLAVMAAKKLWDVFKGGK